MEKGLHLKAEGLGILRGERVLFQGLSLEVRAGEALLLRGDNGAGKTTLLRCLAGLARPETGQRERTAFHWIGHSSGIKPHESPETHLQIWARSLGAEAVNIGDILAIMGLVMAKDVAGAQLSAGQRKRTALARTQLTQRPLWLLDEPFSALDQDGQNLLSKLIATHREAGGAVVVAAHGEVAIGQAREMRL